MVITPQVYRAAADRLHTLADYPGALADAYADSDDLCVDARCWAFQFDGAAEALEHHIAVPPADAALNKSYEQGYDDGRDAGFEASYDKGYNDASEKYERTGIAGALYDAHSRLSAPTPGLDDLDRVLDDMAAALRAYEQEIAQV